MFMPYEEFKKILDSTISLTESLKTSTDDEKEEIQLRIDSNIHALKLIASKIEDPETRAVFLKSIQSLSSNIVIEEQKEVKLGPTHSKNREMIDEELLKNSTRLKGMAEEFRNRLKTDGKILEKVNEKLNKNTQESVRSREILEETSEWVKPTTFLFITFVMFIFVYFVIRFS